MQSGKIGHFDVRFVKERIFTPTLKDPRDLKGKRGLVRADFNVPLDGTTITDDGRIKAALPTIKTLREEGAKVILMAHLGRPKGKVVPELSLAPVAARLGELLGTNVPLAKDTYGEDAQAKVAAMNDGDVVLLENVRFNPEETSKDADERAAYAKKIAALGEAFVSDGFGVVHRAQGSNYDVAADLSAAAGLLVEKEVKALSRATENPERPFTVVLGGSKVSDKLGVIENLLDKANRLVIGGGMVYTFLKAKGLEVGTSLLEEDQVETVKGYAKHEQETLSAVISARNTAVKATTPEAKMEADNVLTGALRQLFAVAEAYPDLKANTNFTQLQASLEDTENKISYARQSYNDCVLSYNNAIQTFPAVIFAGIFQFKERQGFEAAEAARQAPTVKF